MTSVAVVAHSGKSLGGGLGELREVLARNGVTDPLWYEVPKSKKAPKAREGRRRRSRPGLRMGRRRHGATVRRHAGRYRHGLAIMPAGTANLLAANLGIPKDLERAVQIGLHGRRRRLDVGRINGERFAVMAGVGFDARMIRDADRGLKDRVGASRTSPTGAKNLRGRVRMRIEVDGDDVVRRRSGLRADRRTSARSSVASRRSRTRDPTTGAWRSGSSPPTALIQWVRA